jgi:hypothetical protein
MPDALVAAHGSGWKPIACAFGLALAGIVSSAEPSAAQQVQKSVIVYDAETEQEYMQMWANIYGPLELTEGGTREVTREGAKITAVPFHVTADYSVFDHLKYIAVSSRPFSVPENGSLEFSVEITALTPGTEAGRVVRGCYGPPMSYAAVGDPCDRPFQHVVRQGQQAGVVLNMINFETGQLFDWFVAGSTAFALIERLPSNVTGNGDVGLDRAYTQIVKETKIAPGKPQKVAIRYTRGPDNSYVEYFLNDRLFVRVPNVGIPLDRQGYPYTGYAPSLGPGELLKDRLDSFVIGHGLFSLLDAFPYQHPDAPDLSVSIPESERLFGQGAVGTWDKFTVTTKVFE